MFTLLLFLCGTSFCSSWSPLSTCTISQDLRNYGVFVDCSGRGLSEIPKHFPINTTSINLSGNLISSVTNESFIATPHLRSLNLSNNVISSSEPNAFGECYSLNYLNLKSNQICWNGSVFGNLYKLQDLAIDDCYDAEVLKPLTNLTTIEVVADQECYFKGFHYLTNLMNLVITGVFSSKNETFTKLNNSKIRSLRIEGELSRMDINSLAPLVHLQELVFTNTKCDISRPLNALYALVGRNLTTLTLDGVKNTGRSQSVREIEDRTLTKERLKYLSRICISNLSLQRNFILFFDADFIENSPISKCLKYVNLKRNMISYLPIQAVFQFWKLTSLENVEFSDQAKLPVDPSPPKSIVLSNLSVWRTHVKGTFFLHFPEHLTTLTFRSVSNNIAHLNVDIVIINGHRVRKVDFSANELNTLNHINGLPNLEYVDLSGNGNLVLPNNFFCSTPKIKTLKVRDMSFRQHIIDVKGKMHLSCLPKLQSLDISGNRLVELPSDLFQLNPLLKHLDLSRNIFISIPVHLNLLPNLLLLDVSSNSFGSLDKRTTDDIDKHYENSKKLFVLNLSGNFFECSCSNLPFIYWISGTEVLTENNGVLSCITEDGKIRKTKHLIQNILKFWRKCKGYESFTVVVILGTLLLCGILMALLIDTNKTKLAYFLSNALKYQVPKRKRKDFRTDVFLSYADIDYRWACFELGTILEERNLNLFIWDRDSIPGDCTAEVITENVNQCWKTILYFTENYERDAWSYLTTMAAINCVDNLNPERLILLLPQYENPRVPECLLQVVPESCIFYVSREISRDDAFWDELEQAIKKDT